MNDAQTCDLCAGECRGHSLGPDGDWTPEPGSRAYADQTIEQLAREIAAQAYEQWDDIGDPITRAMWAKEIREGLRDELPHVQAARLGILEGMKIQRERDVAIMDSEEVAEAMDCNKVEKYAVHKSTLELAKSAIRSAP